MNLCILSRSLSSSDNCGSRSCSSPILMFGYCCAKDASDKKILVDMLFWAVDNLAPANYLLISGDRDFSNALHQLRMRRYNILLAQPTNASAALAAAAKSVWLWTSLLAGGLPMPKTEVNNSSFTADTTKSQLFNPGKASENKYKTKQPRKNLSQPILPRASSAPVGSQESKNNGISQQPQVVAAPHELLGSSKPMPNGSVPNYRPPNTGNTTWSNGNNAPSNYQHPYSEPSGPNQIPIRPDYFPSNIFPPNSHAHGYQQGPFRPNGPTFTSGPPMSMSEYPNNVQGTSFQQQQQQQQQQQWYGSEPRPNSIPTQNPHMIPKNPSFHPASQNNRHPRGSDPPPPPAPMAVMGTPIFPKGSEHVQGLAGVILIALDSLKRDMITPTEANIIDCIRYGEPNQRNTDVRKALDTAIQYQMVVKANLGALHVYLRKDKPLWNCVNILGNSNSPPKSVWDGIYKFLRPSSMCMLLLAQYEAATILKSSCLTKYVLGNVLQILHMLISSKKWIAVHGNDWQPINITVGSKSDLGSKSDA
ncbi:hypothetical protein ACHQM5_016539 [Ranunculus cassubicifolius]